MKEAIELISGNINNIERGLQSERSFLREHELNLAESKARVSSMEETHARLRSALERMQGLAEFDRLQAQQ